jgi:hypothetical protein
MSRYVWLTLTLSLLLLGTAVASSIQMARLRTDAGFLALRSDALAQQYSKTFDAGYADLQLSTFDQRRDTLRKSLTWQWVGLLSGLCSAALALTAYGLFLHHRLQTELSEKGGGEIPDASSSPLPSR